MIARHQPTRDLHKMGPDNCQSQTTEGDHKALTLPDELLVTDSLGVYSVSF